MKGMGLTRAVVTRMAWIHSPNVCSIAPAHTNEYDDIYMTDKPLSDKQIRRLMLKKLDQLADLNATLYVITEQGDLCKDGQRALSGIVDLTDKLIDRIEKDTNVKGVADNIQKAVNTL
jgi:hypothetical protein